MYRPQIDDLTHVLDDVAGFSGLAEEGVFPDLSRDVVEAVLTEAGRFAGDVLAPLNRVGDEKGCRFDPAAHKVTTAPGWKEAYAQWCEGGWAALPCPAAYGGQGLPVSVALAVQELWNTAVNAYGIGTLLTQGAVEAIDVHGSEDLKQTYLPKLVSGEWMGTMNLTEPQAGSDLGAIKTTGERQADGTYRITGTKIYITYGEHDLTDNIVHLVLARLADAPSGSKGLSMFLVPKMVPNGDGTHEMRNDVKCIGLEEKLGIHGSPTCTLRYGDDGGAVGWLVGEENRGLNCMFTMMNNARLNVGMQGVAVAERAYQQALDYAKERRQGRKAGHDGMVAIIEHPDVRRMLLDMKAKTAAARAVCYCTAAALDLAEHGRSDGERRENLARAALLTPVAKAFGTDIGVEVASLGVQVHGGMGYIEETGAAQHYRDSRITPIYEGTNGIQALDLVARKLPLEGGEAIRREIEAASELANTLSGGADESFAAIGADLAGAAGALSRATAWLQEGLVQQDPRAVAAATPYLRLVGLTLGAAGMARGAWNAARRSNERDAAGRIGLAHYFARNHLPVATGLADIVCNGTDQLVVDDDAELLLV